MSAKMLRRAAWSIAALALPFSPPASAQQPPLTFVVTTLADLLDDNIADDAWRSSANSCSLRAAISRPTA
jgi:CSLREA domain-containing protein